MKLKQKGKRMATKHKAKSDKAAGCSHCACLKLAHPKAREVFIAGSFNDWQLAATPLRSVGDGNWIAELALPPGRYEYRFVVDGQWVDDPAASATVPNPFGGLNAVLEVRPV